ncbi:adenosine deaminase/editase [Dactylonectria estremocensis]|uniref:Adenosine deaminase/editase n=1 Tax=Dactylonectria estremocensis TaxID=1079267 RepID=A0A9P9JHG4_9HYPO|nr:adenosine deaminase/editase [Dactylonectria estremocensis]
MTSRPDLIAKVVLQQFQTLPNKRKPRIHSNGTLEWVPLSGIVAERNGTLTCLALATGMKCLPYDKVSESDGVGIHDWHAEILAIRTFNRFLLDECEMLIRDGTESDVVQRTEPDSSDETGICAKPFKIRDDVKLHMYCSEAPCGDASMELTMAAQIDSSPWQAPVSREPGSESRSKGSLLGRGHFSELGIVRKKPSRPDAPHTLSKSCSDKIALKQCTSLMSSLTSLLVDPANAYIHSLVLPESQYSQTGCSRAFSAEGRMKPLVGRQWPGGYSFNGFVTETTDLEFEYSKRSVKSRVDRISATNIAAAWSHSGVEETIMGGVIQGKKPFIPKGASRMSRRGTWEAARDLAHNLGQQGSSTAAYLGFGTYHDVKNGLLLVERRHVKDQVRETVLTGWVKNDGGSYFKIEERGNH